MTFRIDSSPNLTLGRRGTRQARNHPRVRIYNYCTILILSSVYRFSSKFQKIVQQEQDANFISRLHGGKLEIIPWPVIESKEFYKLFATLKRRLDLQKVSHSTAGEFLHTIKTLMAKLKVCVHFSCHYRYF